MSVYFIDTNIFMYAAGSAHPLKTPCKGIVASMVEGRFQSAINTEVLQEILHRYLSINRKKEAFVCLENTLILTDAVWPVTLDVIREAQKLLQKYPDLMTRDAVHVASMIVNGVKKMISADTDFDGIKEIQRIDPCQMQPPI